MKVGREKGGWGMGGIAVQRHVQSAPLHKVGLARVCKGKHSISMLSNLQPANR